MSFHLLGKKTILPPPQGFLKYEHELDLMQPLTRPRCKIIIAYCTANDRLAMDIGWRSTIPISRDDRLRPICSYNAVKNEAHFCVGVLILLPH